jgi:hypothetical protein
VEQAFHLITSTQQLVKLAMHTADEGATAQRGKRRLAFFCPQVPPPPVYRATKAW